MKKVPFAVFFACLFCAQAEAHFEQSALVTRSRALGGAFVSLADDPSTIFVNPAGMFSDGLFAVYLDYGDPAGMSGGRESRLALAAGADRTGFRFGWYRFAGEDDASENLLMAGAAHKLIEGTQGSFLSIGANASVGNVSIESSRCGKNQSSWSNVTGDIGFILKPLPVISFGYAIGNILNEHFDIEGNVEPWRRVQRWGVSYSWEERVVLSFGEEHFGGRTTGHCGCSVRAAAPIELMAGFSDGNTTGGIRWLGGRLRAAVAFSSDEVRGVTWQCSCEIMYRGAKKEGAE